MVAESETELLLASAGSILEANGVPEQFQPRYNRRFRVPPQCSKSAYRPLDSDLSLDQIRERQRVRAQRHGSRHQPALYRQGRQTQTPPPLPVSFLMT